jgi:hypothetical protein
LLAGIEEWNNGEDDRREAMSLARMFLSARENAQRCAVDCAPYVQRSRPRIFWCVWRSG